MIQKPPSFSESFFLDLGCFLVDNGACLSTYSIFKSGSKQSQSWASSISIEMILREPLLLDENFAWIMTKGKSSKIYFEGIEKSSGRPIHMFNIDFGFKKEVLKQTWNLGEDQALFHRPSGENWGQVSSDILKEWQLEIKNGTLNWESIDEKKINKWKKNILGTWKEYLNINDEALNNAFLDSCLGTSDYYLIQKINRKNELHISPISRTGRMGTPGNEPILKIKPDAQLISSENDVFLEVPLSSGDKIYGYVSQKKTNAKLALKISWFFENKISKNNKIILENFSD